MMLPTLPDLLRTVLEKGGSEMVMDDRYAQCGPGDVTDIRHL